MVSDIEELISPQDLNTWWSDLPEGYITPLSCPWPVRGHTSSCWWSKPSCGPPAASHESSLLPLAPYDAGLRPLSYSWGRPLNAAQEFLQKSVQCQSVGVCTISQRQTQCAMGNIASVTMELLGMCTSVRDWPTTVPQAGNVCSLSQQEYSLNTSCQLQAITFTGFCNCNCNCVHVSPQATKTQTTLVQCPFWK